MAERSWTRSKDSQEKGRGELDSSTRSAPARGERTSLLRRFLQLLRPGGPKDERTPWLSPEVKGQSYFHGMIHKDEIGSLLLADGDFILRLGRSALAEKNITLSVMSAGKPRHFIVDWGGKGKKRQCWVDDAHKFPNEVALAEWYVSTATAMGQGAYVLRRPVSRASWEIDSADVSLRRELGKGAYGKVHLGLFKKKEVAVKLCEHTQDSREAQNLFMKEAEIGRRLDHPNVVKVYGVQCREHPLMIVMELCPEGSLLTFLRREGRELSQRSLLLLCRDAAQGLEYIHGQRIVHRDIAARNFLVGRGRVLKLSDFGLARAECVRYKMHTQLRIALKWCPPEVLTAGDFSHASDVWMLGVTMWEILSHGEEPFNGIPKREVRQRVCGEERLRLVSKVAWGPAFADLLSSCFASAAQRRPSARTVVISLGGLVGNPTTSAPSAHPVPVSSLHSEYENNKPAAK